MSFDTLKLDKGLYTSNKSFTKSLEEIDPSENYKGTELEGLDAYERQLKRFDIKVKGSNSDTISKFFQNTDSSVLFPEYVARAVRLGLDDNGMLDDIVATTTMIDSLDYRSIASENAESVIDIENHINEGAFIPETIIKTNEKLTHLCKCGKSLVASYEALKTQRLDLFTVTLKQIGNYIARCELIKAIDVLADPTARNIGFESPGTIQYIDFINMFKNISPYEFNTVIIEEDILADVLQIEEFKDSMAGQDFHGTGNLVSPLGAKLVVAPTEILGGGIIAIDKRYALEKVQLGDIVTDFDKLIDRQLERATVTSTFGFNRIFDDADVFCS